MLKFSRLIVISLVATFFTLIVFNNVTDYPTNHWCVQSVLTMEGVESSNVMWRAIHAPWIITSAYVTIIAIEAMIAFLCWLAVYLILLGRDGWRFGHFGLMLAFGLFMLGFVIIAGEWFYMWQHPVFVGLQQKTAVFSLLMLVSAYFISPKNIN